MIIDFDAAGGIDAGGAFVMPGLIDTHMHLLLGGRSLHELDLTTARCREDVERAVARRHRELPAGAWLIARGWSRVRLGAMPHLDWLAGAGDRPVVCHSADLHAVLVNRPVLERCDLDAAPAGGTIVRDAGGTPTGVLVEAAAWQLVNPIVPEPSSRELRDHLRSAMTHAHRFGLTTVGTMEYGRTLEHALVPLREELSLRCVVTLLDRDWPLDPSPGAAFAGDDRLTVIGYKTFIDGTLGSGTARMLEPYADDPDHRGLLLELAADGHLNEWVAAVAGAGLSPSMHAIGDEAVRLALDAVAGLSPDTHVRLEHVQHIDPVDIPRTRGHVISMQPLHRAGDARCAERCLGPGRLDGFFAMRSMIDAGGLLAFGSDWPVVTCDPLAGIRAAVTGVIEDGTIYRPQERVTVGEALRAYTSGAAFALRVSNSGVLRPGAAGDLVMLDRDPFEADWIDDPPAIALTVSRGRVVYDERHG